MRYPFVRLFLLFVLWWNYAAPATAQIGFDEALKQQRALLAALKLPENDAASLATQLQRAEVEWAAGTPYLAVYRLQQPWISLSAETTIRSKAGIVKQGQAAYETDWERFGREVAAKEQRLTAATEAKVPLALRAMSQAARLESRPYFQSGRLYGLNTTLDQGYYYMGAVAAKLDFALFCQQLPFPHAHANIRLRSLTQELAQLDQESVKAFRQSGAKDQTRYLLLNATIKLVGELNEQRWWAGALYKYLEANMVLGMLNATPVAADKVATLRTQLEAVAKQLNDGKTDHSLGVLYWQIAQAALTSNNNQPSADDLKRVSAILERVLPRYFKYVSEGKR